MRAKRLARGTSVSPFRRRESPAAATPRTGSGGRTWPTSALIACHRTDHGVPHALACRALGVSQSWFYKVVAATGAHAPRAGPTWPTESPRSSPSRVAPTARRGWRRSCGRRGWRVGQHRRADHGRRGPVARVQWRRRGLTTPGRRAAAKHHVRRQFTAWRRTCSSVVTLDRHRRRQALPGQRAGPVLPPRDRPRVQRGARYRPGRGQPGHGRGRPRRRRRSHLPLRPGSDTPPKAYQPACTRQGIIQSMARVGSALDRAVSEGCGCGCCCPVDVTPRPHAECLPDRWQRHPAVPL